MSFPNGKMKALTFSYDDGVTQDKRLVEIFNHYGMKCTFNINSGIQSPESCWVNNGVEISRLEMAELPELYKGHEVAVHGLTHPWLEKLEIHEIQKEIAQDKENLEKIFGYPMRGMAYPFGTYDERVIKVIADNGLKYARTVKVTHNFEVQTNLLELESTCHHRDEKLMELADAFLEMKPDHPQIFYVWGHSYEFAVNDNWHVIEKFCEKMSGKGDIFYGTNAEVLL